MITFTIPSFDPVNDISNLSGKVIFITGGTSGIGKATVLSLASHNPSHIYFTGRNAQSGSNIVAEAKTCAPACPVTFIQCDLSFSRGVIRRAILDNFTSSRLDIFIANAGVMAVSPGLTAEGFEIQFGANYLGHAIMLRLLRPLMLRTAESDRGDVRLVILSSTGHQLCPPGGIEFDKLRTEDVGSKWQRYGQSKLADILYAKAMAKRYPQITSISVHPGLVRTELGGKVERSTWSPLLMMMLMVLRLTPLYQSPDQGAHNTLWAATTPKDNLENGTYYEPMGKKAGAPRGYSGMARICTDEALADELWGWTENELEGLDEL